MPPSPQFSKINVIGASGSGKSTFARKLAEKRGYPYIQMDALFWQPHWTGSSDEVFFPRLQTALARQSWILDGNYKRSEPIKWAQVQQVVWLDYPFALTLARALKRAVNRAYSGEELWPGTGNRETFRKTFFSKDSVLLWTITSYHEIQARYERTLRDPRYSHIDFIRLRAPQHADEFIRTF